jgi:hypothetical protein
MRSAHRRLELTQENPVPICALNIGAVATVAANQVINERVTL